MRFAKVVVLFLSVLFFWGCRKNTVSPIPNIRFIKQDTYEVADSGKGRERPLIFQLDFTDGDADIGPLDQAVSWQNIHFRDMRDDEKLFFDFPPIPSAVVMEDGIEGTFRVEMPPNVIIARDDTTIHKLTDTVCWEVIVYDNAGNESNAVLTDSVVIIK